MTGLAIGALARRAGLRASAVRYYEARNLLPPPRRESGQRRYDETALDRLAVIQLAQAAGLTLAEIETLLHGFAAGTPPIARWQTLADAKLAELDAVIARAEQMQRVLRSTLACSCATLDECGQSSAGSHA